MQILIYFFVIVAVSLSSNAKADPFAKFCRLVFLGRNLPVDFSTDLVQAEFKLEEPAVTFVTRSNSRQEPHVLSPDRWVDHGLQASLDPAMRNYTNVLDAVWASFKGDHVPQTFARDLQAKMVKAKNAILNFVAELAPETKSKLPAPADDSEKFAEVYLSHNRETAVTYSNYGITRVYEAQTGRLKELIPYQGYAGGFQEGILAVSNQYFLLAQRATDRSGMAVTLRRLNSASKVEYAFNLKYDSLESVAFTRDESKIILVELSNVLVFDVASRTEKYIFLNMDLDMSGSDFISTATLLKDEKTLLLGIKRAGLNGGGSELVTLDLENNLVSDPVEIPGMDQVDAISNLQRGFPLSDFIRLANVTGRILSWSGPDRIVKNKILIPRPHRKVHAWPNEL